MKLTYDPRHNIAYLRLHDITAKVETVQVSDELNVDTAPDGSVYGIDLLNADQLMREVVGGKLLVQNEATGEGVEIALP